MEMRTYRAKSMQEAIELVRRDLGPDASVLHVREIRDGVLSWMGGGRKLEITASATIQAPSRFSESTSEPSQPPPARTSSEEPKQLPIQTPPPEPRVAGPRIASRGRANTHLPQRYEPRSSPEDWRPDERLAHASEKLSLRAEDRQLSVFDPMPASERNEARADSATPPHPRGANAEDIKMAVYAELIGADWSENAATELLNQCPIDWTEVTRRGALESLARSVSNDIPIAGPIRTAPGKCRVAALIGPTGVGKTTTIAKLAANFRLREGLRVGLITVDTYRIAAVDQLKTYADIIDLPMSVVATPDEMRSAVETMAQDNDLILMDTAGRSPSDEIKIRELRRILAEASPDEIHLVVSSTSSAKSLRKALNRFQDLGATSLILTKVDEVDGLGGVWPELQDAAAPLSYVTHGQNVPDDIRLATGSDLAARIVGLTAEDSLVNSPANP